LKLLLIFSEHITPRLNYVIRFIFDQFLGIKTDITSDKDFFINSDLPKISYLSGRITNEFNISPDGILFEQEIKEKHPDMQMWNDLPVIFPANNPANLPFDIFAAIFFMLTRYEEYLPYTPDRYGRFPATESLNFKYSFLEKAVVDRWIHAFFVALKDKYPELISKERTYRFIPTVDVDIPYAYLHKGVFRCLGGAILSIIKLEFNKLNERLQVIAGKQPDPFYTFDRIREMHPDGELITFFLTADYGRYDKGIHPQKNAFKELVSKVSSFSQLGLHPSYNSGKRNNILKKELHALEHIAGGKIDRSRQHYLKLLFPETYNILSELGIGEDYSMGYASHPGFRAGTCTPFNFYDLLREQESTLKVIPFQLMDVTLKNYLGLSPGGAMDKIKNLAEEVRSVNGTLISIWHNDSFSDSGEWAGWLEVYQKLLVFAKEQVTL